MFGVPPGPAVICTLSNTEFVNDFEPSEAEGIFIVREVRPYAPSRGLVEMPVCPFNGFNGEFDARTAVPHVDVKHRQGRSRMLPVCPLRSLRDRFFNGHSGKAFGSPVCCIVEQPALGKPDVADVSLFPRSRCSCGHGG